MYTNLSLTKYRRIFLYFSAVIHPCTVKRGICSGGGDVRAWANHSCRRSRRGDVVFNVRLGVSLYSFPPYITLYDPYRIALAPPLPPPRPSHVAGTKILFAKNHQHRRHWKHCRSVVGREISRNSKVWKKTNHSRRTRRRRQQLLYT